MATEADSGGGITTEQLDYRGGAEQDLPSGVRLGQSWPPAGGQGAVSDPHIVVYGADDGEPTRGGAHAYYRAAGDHRSYRGDVWSVGPIAQRLRIAVHTWRANTITPSATPIAAPKPRAVTGWIIRPVADRSESEHADLAGILERCPALRSVDALVSDFGGMLRQRQGQHLDSWIAKAQASDIAPLRGFATGLLKDYDAVRNGLTLGWSSGAVEGTVTKIKSLKRAMYGRANFDLLRRRILLGT